MAAGILPTLRKNCPIFCQAASLYHQNPTELLLEPRRLVDAIDHGEDRA
jgi:hypothetical protein